MAESKIGNVRLGVAALRRENRQLTTPASSARTPAAVQYIDIFSRPSLCVSHFIFILRLLRPYRCSSSSSSSFHSWSARTWNWSLARQCRAEPSPIVLNKRPSYFNENVSERRCVSQMRKLLSGETVSPPLTSRRQPCAYYVVIRPIAEV